MCRPLVSNAFLHPLSCALVLTLPVLQVLCAAASQACSQAEHSMCSSASQQAVSTLHLKDIECLCQLSTATLQLSSAVCCDPAVALPLVSAGTRNPALEQLKEAVKSLTSMWTACMIRLQQQDVHGPAGDSEYAGHPAGSQHAWQCLIPSLAASVRHLLHMSVTSADFLSGTSSSSQQTEMCSMAALNLSWANLTRLLVAVPDDVRPQVSQKFPLCPPHAWLCWLVRQGSRAGSALVLVCHVVVCMMLHWLWGHQGPAGKVILRPACLSTCSCLRLLNCYMDCTDKNADAPPPPHTHMVVCMMLESARGPVIHCLGFALQVLEAHELLHGLQCACQQLHTAVAELPVHGRKRCGTQQLQGNSRLPTALCSYWRVLSQLTQAYSAVISCCSRSSSSTIGTRYMHSTC
jgi:hypothetical protein